MKETNSKIAALAESYNAPKARVITVKVEGIICDSIYGEEGAAGNGFNNDNTTHYDDEL